MKRITAIVALAGVAILIGLWIAQRDSSDEQGPAVTRDAQLAAETTEQIELQTAGPSPAFEAAEAEIERLRNELAVAAGSTNRQESAAPEAPQSPEGYTGSSRAFGSYAQERFEAESMDSTWAPTAESELFSAIHDHIYSDGLAVSLVNVRCKSEACRIQLSFSQQPTSRAELSEIVSPAFALSHAVANAAGSVAYSGLFQVRTDFPGEPTTADVYLFRSGNDGVFLGMRTPQGEELHCTQASCYPEADND